MLFFGETDTRGEKGGDREKEKHGAARGGDAVKPYEFKFSIHTHTPQPTSRLYVSFGLEVWDEEEEEEGTHPPQSQRANEHK